MTITTLSRNIALVGTPNCGKSALFNALTGIRQKVANYPGVTVERRVGEMRVVHRLAVSEGVECPDGGICVHRVIDLPGTYSFAAKSPDEVITREVVLGQSQVEAVPDVILCVVDATALRSQLRFVLEVRALGRPMVVALNMMDMAKRDGTEIDVDRLSLELGVPVIPTVAVRKTGLKPLFEQLPRILDAPELALPKLTEAKDERLSDQARRIARNALIHEGVKVRMTRKIDSVLLHEIAGPILFAAFMFLLFQAVFSWAEAPMNLIDAATVWLQALAIDHISVPWLQSLVVEGIIAGVGSVIIFLPQILILFAFVIVLEQSGYMARAAFLMDRVMAAVGLNGHAFIPLLSSFACAIPGIMAARTIPEERDRLTTILIAPLVTCSARLPVYTLIIAAFIPNKTVLGFIGLQGLIMFGLYLSGIASALLVAFILKRTLISGGTAAPFMMVMPKYQLPQIRDLLLGLWIRGSAFIRRAGGIILLSMVALWVLASFPGGGIYNSFAGIFGRALAVILEPIGFSWEIAIALIPGMAAREVAVAALGTVYALQGSEEAVATSLVETLRAAWSLPTALSFLAWYVFAPQCLATLAVIKRETGGWRWPIFTFAYLFVLAYVGSGLVYWISRFII